MVTRRNFLGLAAGAGASLALTAPMLRALGLRQPVGPLIQRAIPSTGEMLPAVGLSFSNHPSCADHAALREVLRAMVDSGGTVFDAMHGDPSAEEFHARLARELGVQDRLFWSTRGTAPGGPGGPPQAGATTVKAHIDLWLARTQSRQMDLVMLPAQGDPSWLEALKAEKRAGRVRYIGVQVIADNSYPELEAVMRREPIDFIGVDYDISNRARVEDTILPLALERKIGVMAFFPFGNNGGVSCGSGANLFGRVGARPLPAWAAEFDAATWAQFFLKYVLGHPAITVARVGTTKAHHMLDNLGGGVGRLPSEAMRRRMAALIDELPPVTLATGAQSTWAHGPPGGIVLSPAVLDRYVGNYRAANGTSMRFRRYGSMLVATVGNEPDRAIFGPTPTRFWYGPNTIEFQTADEGPATGLVYTSGGQRITATRTR